MKGILFLLLILILSGCVSLTYIDPSTGAELSYSSYGKTVKEVEIVYTSPEKTVAVSIGETSNDQIFEQIGDIIAAYKISPPLLN